MIYIAVSTDRALSHYGILGQKWGVRRYQNEDGTLTEAGKERYRTQNKQQYIDTLSKFSDKEKTMKKLSKNTKYEEHMRELTKFKDAGNMKKDLEQWLLSLGTAKDFDVMPEKIQDLYVALFHRISEESGDWYFGESVTDKFRDAYSKYLSAVEQYQKMNDEYWRAKKSGSASKKHQADVNWSMAKDELVKSEDDLCGVVLTDLGYDDNPTSRSLIYDSIFWD